MALNDSDVTKLLHVIRNSFRVRKNQDPLYVDLANNLARVEAPQHQVIFGRRGSGKSCLLIHYFNQAKLKGVLPVYILADTYKKLTYPDILIRLLIHITDELQKTQPLPGRWFLRKSPLRRSIRDLRKLLDSPGSAEVTQDTSRRTQEGADAEIASKAVGKAKATCRTENHSGRTSSFKEHKLELLERQLHDHKVAVEYALSRLPYDRACVLLDDFYLLPRSWHADVMDYLHRLARDTDLYLKIAFLVSQDEAQERPEDHGIIQQLMDMKLIHVIEPDTSAASGRQGRFEAYTLEFSLFMEPRRRNIQIVEFWVRGEDSHKKGIREAPVYPLERARAAFSGDDAMTPEAVLESMTPEAASSPPGPEQQELFPNLE